jgi:hypothetical protein
MVIMPDNDICCGLQLSTPPEAAAGGKDDGRAGADVHAGAKPA